MAGHLGDGPALALSYGVPSISAALLCQMGFASRVGAVLATTRLSATFEDFDRMRSWMGENDSMLSRMDFWESPDQYLLMESCVPDAC